MEDDATGCNVKPLNNLGAAIVRNGEAAGRGRAAWKLKEEEEAEDGDELPSDIISSSSAGAAAPKTCCFVGWGAGGAEASS